MEFAVCRTLPGSNPSRKTQLGGKLLMRGGCLCASPEPCTGQKLLELWGASDVMKVRGRFTLPLTSVDLREERPRSTRADGGFAEPGGRTGLSLCRPGHPEAPGLPSSAPARAAGPRGQSSQGWRHPDATFLSASAQPAPDTASLESPLPAQRSGLSLTQRSSSSSGPFWLKCRA